MSGGRKKSHRFASVAWCIAASNASDLTVATSHCMEKSAQNETKTEHKEKKHTSKRHETKTKRKDTKKKNQTERNETKRTDDQIKTNKNLTYQVQKYKYHAVCKVDYQPLDRPYSQLTYLATPLYIRNKTEKRTANENRERTLQDAHRKQGRSIGATSP